MFLLILIYACYFFNLISKKITTIYTVPAFKRRTFICKGSHPYLGGNTKLQIVVILLTNPPAKIMPSVVI